MGTSGLRVRVIQQIQQRYIVKELVITSDHGQEFFEHGNKGHYKTLYDEVIMIPLIFYWPSHLKEGTVIEERVQLIDIMPMILSLSGIPFQGDIQGEDISRVLQGQDTLDRPAFCELLLNRGLLRALRTMRSKLMVDGHRNVYTYFDLVKDPGELHPVTKKNNDLENAFARLNETIRENLIRLNKLDVRDNRKIELDKQLDDQLRSLGYVGD